MANVVYLGEELGFGRFGKVYDVVGGNLWWPKHYALKVPQHSELSYLRLDREKALLRRLQHGARKNHIVRLLHENARVLVGNFLLPSLLWQERVDLSRSNLVLEKGLGNLRRVGNPQALSEKERLNLLLVLAPQILEAVRFCHGQGIAHLDIKAENILCLASDCTDIVLSDFGVSWRGPKDGDFNGLRGTAPYIAPEQHQKFKDKKDFKISMSLWYSDDTMVSIDDAKLMDWFSVGFLCFETLCCGLQMVHHGLLIQAIEEGTDNGALRTGLFGFVTGLLHPDPSKRMNPDLQRTWSDIHKVFRGSMRFSADQ